jgi:hypothetical protein
LLCHQCGLPLAGGDEAALFTCPNCGLVHETNGAELTPFPASTAAVTTGLAVAGDLRYVAVWRLQPAKTAQGDPVWDSMRRAAAPSEPHLYVPAFSLARAVVQRLGVRLTEVQPALELTPVPPVARVLRPALAEAGPAASPSEGVDGFLDPGSEAVSPIQVGRREAWGLAYFIYMAMLARETHDLQPAGVQLEPGRQELVFLPAVWDPRCIHESNWRLLLREFDGLVA